MAHQFRLSSDILSPIHSDISLNDCSTFSLGSPLGTPDIDVRLKTLENRLPEKNSGPNAQRRNSEKDISAFEMILTDVKKESCTNADKEEKFKTTYKQLKQSMNDMFSNKMADFNILSPISNQEKCLSAENIGYESSRKEPKELLQTSNKPKEMSLPSILESPRKRSDSKYENDIGKSKVDKKNHQGRNASKSKEFVKKSDKKSCLDDEQVKNATRSLESAAKSSDKLSKESKQIKSAFHSKQPVKNCSEVENFDIELGLKGDGRKSQRNKYLGMVSSSTQTCESLYGASSNKMVRVVDDKKPDNLLNKYNKQRKNPNIISNPGSKDLSIEKSIQIAVGMELDKVRGLMLDQNNCLLKEMLRLQDMTRKQNEVTQYLFTIIEDLVDVNKRLISKPS